MEAPPAKSRVTQSSKKVMASIFWDWERILLIDFKERNTSVNAKYYATHLHRLRDAIKQKRREKLARRFWLLHDNLPVHTAVISKAAVKACGFTEFSQPYYTSYLVPSNY